MIKLLSTFYFILLICFFIFGTLYQSQLRQQQQQQILQKQNLTSSPLHFYNIEKGERIIHTSFWGKNNYWDLFSKGRGHTKDPESKRYYLYFDEHSYQDNTVSFLRNNSDSFYNDSIYENWATKDLYHLIIYDSTFFDGSYYIVSSTWYKLIPNKPSPHSSPSVSSLGEYSALFPAITSSSTSQRYLHLQNSTFLSGSKDAFTKTLSKSSSDWEHGAGTTYTYHDINENTKSFSSSWSSDPRPPNQRAYSLLFKHLYINDDYDSYNANFIYSYSRIPSPPDKALGSFSFTPSSVGFENSNYNYPFIKVHSDAFQKGSKPLFTKLFSSGIWKLDPPLLVSSPNNKTRLFKDLLFALPKENLKNWTLSISQEFLSKVLFITFFKEYIKPKLPEKPPISYHPLSYFGKTTTENNYHHIKLLDIDKLDKSNQELKDKWLVLEDDVKSNTNYKQTLINIIAKNPSSKVSFSAQWWKTSDDAYHLQLTSLPKRKEKSILKPLFLSWLPLFFFFSFFAVIFILKKFSSLKKN